MKAQTRIALLLLVPAVSLAQVPVDDDGNAIGSYQSQADVMSIGETEVAPLSQAELQELVGPIALYPDDLLAIVLPASAYPLQIVEASRFLEALKADPRLKPNPDWDDSIVALLNYPEVIELLNKDLDWTLRLGEAVVAQQTDVVSAVEAFRDRAYNAGNLKSDTHQTVARDDDDVIYISPAEEDVIYVPYYEPAQVVYYQPTPVYHYYPRSYPVYYYPYAAGHYFDRGFFWGVTTAFTIGWITDSLHVYHHSYYGHPYYGHSYHNDWYRRPSISVYNNTYVGNSHGYNNRHSNGDRWHARNTRREYVRREGYARSDHRDTQQVVKKERQYEPISFRERDVQRTQRTRANPTQLAHNRSDRSENHSGDVAVRSSNSRQQRQTVQSRDTRRQEAAVRSRTAQRQEPGVQSRTTRRQQPTVRSRDSGQQARAERAPARTQQAPARSEHRQAESRPRQQPSQARESHSQQQSSSNSKKSERRSSESRSRSRKER
jgi:hypothetical protein